MREVQYKTWYTVDWGGGEKKGKFRDKPGRIAVLVKRGLVR